LAMVLASACCSEETRAYKATRSEHWLLAEDMVINLHNVVEGQRAIPGSGALWSTWRRPSVDEQREAPTHRRDQNMLVRCGSVVKCELACERIATGDGTWPTP